MKNLTLCQQNSILGGSTAGILICSTTSFLVGYYIGLSYDLPEKKIKELCTNAYDEGFSQGYGFGRNDGLTIAVTGSTNL